MSYLDKLSLVANRKLDESHRIKNILREGFLNRGLIHKNDIVLEQEKTLATVDGAVVVQQLHMGDLIHTCAVSSEGNTTSSLFEDNGPADYFSTYVDHDSKNSQSASSVMALQEVLLLNDPNIIHDIKVIDGAWYPGFIAVMKMAFGSVQGSALISEYLLQRIREKEDEDFMFAFDKRINPWDHLGASETIAISKSDSSVYWNDMVHEILVENNLESPIDVFYDRSLASLILDAGEFLSPYPLSYERSEAWNVKKPNKDFPGYRGPVNIGASREEQKIIRDFFRGVTTEGYGTGLSVGDSLRKNIEEKWLWSSYFKPTSHGEYGRPLRIDFCRDNHKTLPSDIVTKTNIILSSVNNDIIPDIQEPLSQYYADRKAKEISEVSKITKEYIAAQTSSEWGRVALAKNYRT